MPVSPRTLTPPSPPDCYPHFNTYHSHCIIISNTISPLPSETFEEISNQSNSDLGGSDRYPSCHILTLLSSAPMPTVHQFFPASSESELIHLLPVEVFEHIIDQSSDHDGSLCSLSLTCRAFLPRARLNLFFHIHIGYKEKLESAPGFLESQPLIPPLVRCLTICDYYRRDSFMLLAAVPQRLVAMLPRLHSLEFVANWRGKGQSPHTSRYTLGYSPLMLSVLRKSYAPIQRLELTTLWFSTMADFMLLLCALPRLRSLVCGGTIQFQSDGTISLIQSKTLPLTHLLVVRCISALNMDTP